VKLFTRSLYHVCVVLCLLPSCASVSQSALINDWRHSYEEDTELLKVYRPSEYDFPIGWGRSGMKIDPKGAFTLFYVAPNDAIGAAEGNWQLNKNILNINFLDPERPDMTMEIQEVDKTILRIKL
jgi:hypothetical protein